MRAQPAGGFARGLAAAAAATALLAASGGPARAGIMVPEVVVGGGWTWAVDGEPGTGGAAGTLALQWPFARAWSFGAALFAQDMGTGLSELQDPNTGEILGTVATSHRWSYGLEWRGEGQFRASGPLRWLWNGGMGYARQERDQRGVVNDAVSGITMSTGLTGLWQTARANAFGFTLQYRHLFLEQDANSDRATHCGSASVEWRWRRTSKE